MPTLKWTPEEDAILYQLWVVEGLPTVPVAERMGKTRNAVIGRAHRLGFPPRPSPIGIRLAEAEQKRREAEREKRRLAREARELLLLEKFAVVKPQPQPKHRVVVKQMVTQPTPVVTRRSEPCCYPIGEPGNRNFRYCDEPTKPGKSYCQEHYDLCIRVVPAREAPSGEGFGRLTRVFGG